MSNALFFLKNRADDATVVASSEANAALSGENVQDEQRTKVWRSGTGEQSYLDFSMPSNYSITHAIVVDCNLHPSGTIRVQSWGSGIDKHLLKSAEDVSFDFARATAGVATFVDRDGFLKTAIADAPRFDFDPVTLTLNGLLCEPERTNRCLQNQDKSQADWVKTNITVGTDVDWDGVTRSIKLTSTAANATITQAITNASVERVYSVALKRVTGSGVVEITVDNGSTWLDVTSLINSSTFTVVSKTQTLVDPTVGIRIVTSGDVVLATLDQEETGSKYTSRIPTVASAATRPADDPNQLLSALAGYSATQGTFIVRAKKRDNTVATEAECLLSVDDGVNERFTITRVGATGVLNCEVIDGGVSQASLGPTVADWSASNRFGLGWQDSNFKACVNGGTIATNGAGTLPTPTTIRIGENETGVNQFNGWIQGVIFYATILSDTDFQDATSGTAITPVPILNLDFTVVPGVDETVAPTVFVEEDESSFYGLGGYGVGVYGGAPSNVDPQGNNITLIPFDAAIHRHWRITFTDAATTYQQVGRVFLGAPTEFGVNMSYGWSTRQEERSQSRESIGGQRYSQPRDDRQIIRGAFDWLTDDERTTFLRSYRRVGDTTPIIFSLIPESSFAGLTTTIYGRLNAPEISGSFYDINSLAFEVVEEL